MGLSLSLPLLAQDWPTYMHDNSRSGVTSAKLTLPLQEQWVYTAPAAPVPAWPDPQDGWTELPKLRFDDAFYTVSVGDTVYFGSSVDFKVYAMDAATGKVRWSFFTGGPVRLAPTVDKGRVFAGSDDGYVYCLNAADGALLWKYSGMPKQRYLLGSGRMISLWPIRTGLVVDRDIVYFGVGIFPTNGIALVALNAADGTVVWRNDKASYRQDFSPQGYPLLLDNVLVAPSGRTLPKCFNRATGDFLFAPTLIKGLGKGQASGGYLAAVGKQFYLGSQNILHAFNQETGNYTLAWPSAKRVIATQTHYFVLKGLDPPAYGRIKPDQITEVIVYDRAMADQAGKRDAATLQPALKWRYKRAGLDSLIVAENIVLAGGSNEIYALDAVTGKEMWKGPVNGRAAGLTTANGRVLVSTDTGAIHCFGNGAPAPKPAKANAEPFPAEPTIVQTAQAIIAKTSANKGYCLVIGKGSARLGYEIAKGSNLQVFCAEYDEADVKQAQQALDATGLYGRRVVVNLVTPDALPYSDYFANMIVQLSSPGQPMPSAKELLRVLKPSGGMLLAGQIMRTGSTPLPPETIALWKTAGEFTADNILVQNAAPWATLKRGPLPGAGSWTHQYADPGNTGSSEDTLVNSNALDVLWYGEPGAGEVPDRHLRTVAPLSINGLVFHQAFNFKMNRNYIICFDAYNGVKYWEREIPGAYRVSIPNDSGNLACTSDSLFVAAGPKCYRLNNISGEILATYDTPPGNDGKTYDWGYLAVTDGLIIGSRRVSNEVPKANITVTATEYQKSDLLFAYDLSTGKLKWTNDAGVFRIATISISDGRVCFVIPSTKQAGPSEDEAARANRLGTASADGVAETDEDAPDAEAAAPAPTSATAPPQIRTVVALHVSTGKEAWRKDVDLSYSGGVSLAKNGVLVFGVNSSPYGGKKDPNRRVVALSTQDGSPLWNKAVGNSSRLVIIGDTLIAQPSAYNLRTGEVKMTTNKKGTPVPWAMGRMSACGAMSASANMLFFREGSAVWFNTVTLARTGFGGMRPGCWINIIPVNGLVVQPEASSGCMCYHSIQCSMVYKPREATPPKP